MFYYLNIIKKEDKNFIMKNVTVAWLVLSSFGIMFAFLSWLQESTLFLDHLLSGSKKGFLAFILGLVLYKYLARKA